MCRVMARLFRRHAQAHWKLTWDCGLHGRYKGIYMKFRGNGRIEDVLYENIVMDAPEQYGIWIG